MFEDSPIKKILFDTLVEMGRLPSNPSESTIQTINDISDSEALKLLRSLPGTGPTIQKAGGGMMNMDEMIKPIGMAGGGEFKDQLELEIIKLESTIKGLRADEVLTGTDNSRAIQGNQNLLEYYRSLR